MNEKTVRMIVESWFVEHADSSDAGYSVVTWDDLESLIQTLANELRP